MTPLSKRFEIEIQIVDHCNLKCDNCNHFANLAKEWYMSIEEFTFNVNKIFLHRLFSNVPMIILFTSFIGIIQVKS